MNRTLWPMAAILCSALALGACTSSRFGGHGPGSASAAAPAPAPLSDPIEAVPSGPVLAEPLPPLPGEGGMTPAPAAPGTDIAALPPAAQQAAPPPAPAPSQGRSSLVGGWSARDASGASCRVQLSSAPALDLYRASATGCANQDLAKISAWDYRDGEIYLYQSGGTVAARLRGSGGTLNGVLAKSGAPLTLAR
jgi:Protease inhibitor Inh